MHSALDNRTGEIIEAETLWEIEATDGVDSDRYVCIGCRVKVWPISYKVTNLSRPYFQMRKPNEHIDCDVIALDKLIEKGKKERITPTGGVFPAHYSSRLVLREALRVIDPGTDNDPDQDGALDEARARRPHDPNAPRVQRPTTAGTIRPICRSFVNFPHDRDRKLIIDGIDGDSYRKVFKKLQWATLQQFAVSKLFYAPLSWCAATSTPDSLEVTLDAGEWGEDRKKPPESPFRVRIDWRDWSPARRTVVAYEIDVTRKEGPKESKNKGYLFFLGTQDHDDPTHDSCERPPPDLQLCGRYPVSEILIVVLLARASRAIFVSAKLACFS